MLQTATFEAGCFWGTKEYFEAIPGVIMAKPGVVEGGTVISEGQAVQLQYDPALVNYDTLVKHFIKLEGQLAEARHSRDDRKNCKSVLYFHSEEQRIVAEITLKKLQHPLKGTNGIYIEPLAAFRETIAENCEACAVPFTPL